MHLKETFESAFVMLNVFIAQQMIVMIITSLRHLLC